MIAPADLFDLEGLTHAQLFDGLDHVWLALDRIQNLSAELAERDGHTGRVLRVSFGEVMPITVVLHRGMVYEDNFCLLGGDPTKGGMCVELAGCKVYDAVVVHAGAAIMSDDIHLAPGVKVEPGALLKGPCHIGPGAEVRQGAYIRGAALVGAGCVVGHATELKNAAMLDGAKAGHFAYLGDSILGRDCNLGAGAKLANLKIVDRPHRLVVGEQTHVVERRKFGAIMGDGCETGCNSVTNPGVILGRRCMVAPCVSVAGGYYKPRAIIR